MSALLSVLFDALLETPDDVASRAALIDCLLDNDDPRAELLRVTPALLSLPVALRLRSGVEEAPPYRLPEVYRRGGHLVSGRLVGIAAAIEMLQWGRSSFQTDDWLACRRHLAGAELAACRLVGFDKRRHVMLTGDVLPSLLARQPLLELHQQRFWTALLRQANGGKSTRSMDVCMHAETILWWRPPSVTLPWPEFAPDGARANGRLLLRTRHWEFFDQFASLEMWRAEQAFLRSQGRRNQG